MNVAVWLISLALALYNARQVVVWHRRERARRVEFYEKMLELRAKYDADRETLKQRVTVLLKRDYNVELN